MKNVFLKDLKKNYVLEKRIIPKYSEIHKNGMNFYIHSYKILGVGNLSIITMSAFWGIMKMETIILTPLIKDTPLFSYDCIQVMGKDTLLLELYDTQLVPADCKELENIKRKYQHLPDYSLGKHWYDNLKLSASLAKRGKKLFPLYKDLSYKYFRAYLKLLEASPICPKHEKQAKVKNYVDGLLSQGGPSTNQFKKMIGANETRKLFTKYIFASEGF